MTRTSRQLYSIGHGTRPAAEFLALLQKYGVDYLIDVRTLPFSRFNPQYNQKALNAFLGANNIRYVFMGDSLGGRPKDAGCYNEKGKIDYSLLEKKPYYREGLERLQTAFQKGIRAAIMCSERKPRDCHRFKLIGKSLFEMGIEVQHIDESGELRSQGSLQVS
jgi:uncharacterized protein (DUF488 family)